MTDEVKCNNHFVDYNKCMAKKTYKSVNLIQCPNKKSCGDFCGKHKNYISKGLKKIDELIFLMDIEKEYLDKNKNSLDKIDFDINKDTISNIKNKKESHNNISDKINKKLLLIDDYYIDKTLDVYTDKTIIKSASHYKLLPSKFINNKGISKTQMKINILHNSKNKLVNLFYMIDIANKNNDKLIILQRNIRKILDNIKINLHGPAYKNKTLCNNETDFYSFDKLKDIQNKYFFSYKSNDGFIYGFHIESFVQLIDNNIIVLNPYNRERVDKNIILKAKKIWSKLEKENKCSKEIKSIVSNDIRIKVRNKILTTFQKIDLFGFQTNLNWIYNCTLQKTKVLFKHLMNYWYYKSDFNDTMRIQIYPNELENPLFSDNLARKIDRTINKYVVMDYVIDIIDKLVSSGIEESDKQNGCIIVLMTINEINRECGQSNSWML